MEVAAAIIGVTDMAIRTSSKIWALSAAWRDAPADIYNLRDDLTRTERFFGEILAHLKTSQFRTFESEKDHGLFHSINSSDEPTELGHLVDEGAAALRRIEAILDGFTRDSVNETGSMGKIDLGKTRKLLWLRHSKKVARLRKELAHIRSSICRLLIAQNISLSSEMYTSLQQSQDSLHSHLGSISTSLTTSQDTLSQVDNRIQSMENKILVAIQQNNHVHHAANTITNSTSQIPPQYETSPSKQTCKTTCPCPCHHPTSHIYRFTLHRSLTGIAAIAYHVRPPCPPTNSCPSNNQPQTHLQILLTLPAWLSRLSIACFISTAPHGPCSGLNIHLRLYTQRSLLESQAPTGPLRLIDQDDIPRLRTALSTRQTSIYDLYCKGQTGLLTAIIQRRVEIARMFLGAGADPFHRDDDGVSAVRLGFLMGLSCRSTSDDGVEKQIGEMLQTGGHVERYVEEEGGFGVLHRGVISRQNLGLLLVDYDAQGGIDDGNEGGLTALHLAATMGDCHAVRTLLRAGATVDARTGTGETPLWYACRYGHVEAVRVLLGGGADMKARNGEGKAPVHVATVSRRANEVWDVLLACGADVNEMAGGYGYRPLTQAVTLGPVGAVEYLLDRGADISVRATNYGHTFLHMAIWCRAHEKAGILLRRGAGLTGVDRTWRNVLHFLASNGDERMMGIFTETKAWKGWTGILAKDEFGLTPLSLLNARKPSHELREAFDRLLNWIEECSDEDLSDDDLSADEFFDAEELHTDTK
ncbi:hypothetical protein OQA88_13341 [Cercophora sp. LCS_1]